MESNTSSKILNRGGSSEALDKHLVVEQKVSDKIFGVNCDQAFADVIAQCLNNLPPVSLDVETDSSEDYVYDVATGPQLCDLGAEVDSKFGIGVTHCLGSLGITLNSRLVCGCGKLGTHATVAHSHLVCRDLTSACLANRCSDRSQRLQPNVVARTVATLTGHTRLGRDMKFIELLGALAGYPFICACGNIVTCLDAPFSACDFCMAYTGRS